MAIGSDMAIAVLLADAATRAMATYIHLPFPPSSDCWWTYVASCCRDIDKFTEIHRLLCTVLAQDAVVVRAVAKPSLRGSVPVSKSRSTSEEVSGQKQEQD